jgi:lipopolysaccharide transport system permease protein
VIRPPSFSINTIVSGIATLFDYRDLLYTLTLFRLTVRYKQSILGWVWAALQPLAMMLIYAFVFSRVVHITTEKEPYPLFVFAALLPWTFFSGGVSNAINGLVSYTDVLTKLHFPREIIPLSYVFAALVDFAIACSILGGLMMYYRVPLHWTALYALPVIAILIGFTSAVSLFLSSVQVRFRDVGAALPVALQLGMFATPVVYPLTSVPTRFRSFYLLNPVANLIEIFRRAVLSGSAPVGSMLLISGVITVSCLAVAYAYFKATEANMSDMI